MGRTGPSLLANAYSWSRSDGEFAEIWLRGCRDLESLDDVEKVRFTHHLLDMLNLANLCR